MALFSGNTNDIISRLWRLRRGLPFGAYSLTPTAPFAFSESPRAEVMRQTRPPMWRWRRKVSISASSIGRSWTPRARPGKRLPAPPKPSTCLRETLFPVLTWVKTDRRLFCIKLRQANVTRRRASMFRNLLVHIPTERSARPAVDGSVSLAVTSRAHVNAVAVGYESTSIPFVAEGGAAVASIYEVERERAMERATAALEFFQAKAKPAGISHSCQAIACPPGEALRNLAEISRLYDL